MILVALTLIDLTLAANLLLIVMFSGYESFVSKFDIDVGDDKPGWMGKVNLRPERIRRWQLAHHPPRGSRSLGGQAVRVRGADVSVHRLDLQ